MPRTVKAKTKVKRKSKAKVRNRKPKATTKKPSLVGLGVDWTEEIDLLFTDLAPELCDTPDKCKMLVVRVTLRDGSEYLVSGHGKRVVNYPNGTYETVCMHFIGQDSQKRRVAFSVRPDDVFKIELVDVPEKEERPPFGFATRIHHEDPLEPIHHLKNELNEEGVSTNASQTAR